MLRQSTVSHAYLCANPLGNWWILLTCKAAINTLLWSIEHKGEGMKRLLLAIACFSAVAVQGCAYRYHLVKKPGVFTQVNLHAEPANRTGQKGWISSAYNQGPILLPMCSEVHLLASNPDNVVFRVKDSPDVWRYLIHKKTTRQLRLQAQSKNIAPQLTTHLNRIFGVACNWDAVEAMSDVDRQGIKQGRAIEGMSRDGVIKAIGYPPEFLTTDLASPAWTFLGHGMRIKIYFEGDIVSEIEKGGFRENPQRR